MSSDNQENRPIAGALTFPVRSNDAVQSAPVQPRQPRNLQGLLRFAMEATKVEDAPGNSELGPMDEERRKFLQDALKSLTINVAEVLEKAIKVLTDAEKIHSIHIGPVPQDVETAFNDLLEFIDDIDIANDFYKMGGFQIFPVAYGCENDQVRLYASTVLAELCQNNPFCQGRALECGLLNVLLNLVHTEKDAGLSKCLYAISCITREFEPACKELTAQGGCAVLAQMLSEHNAIARTKAAFLVRYLCRHFTPAKEEFIKLNIVRTIATQIKQQRDDSTEHLLGTLQALLEGLDPTVLSQCRNPALGLRGILENHLKHPDLADDRFKEEIEYCQELLNQLFANYTEIDALEEEAER